MLLFSAVDQPASYDFFSFNKRKIAIVKLIWVDEISCVGPGAKRFATPAPGVTLRGDQLMARVPSLFGPGSLWGTGGSDPFLTLHREMNRLFDDVLRGSPVSSGGQQGSSQAGVLLAPHLDVSETDTALRIQAELPGVSENDIEVSLHEDVLTIRAEKKQERKEEREGVHFSERAFGTFQRSLRLPYQVNPEQVQARFENGVLSVTLPKTQPQERRQRIPVQGAQQQASIGQDQASQGGQSTGQGGSGSASGSAVS
jgi:HSP20 family protein